MALRVLLADESSTIKKVFQLALQDFAAEVKPVNLGVDVLPVAQSFKPDIIFADVLLQKRNGYEVSAELKQDPALKSIPVVLMWSGFMELDEDKYQASMANAQLEKPFDVAALRKLVTELVPKTQSQRLSQFLSFPKMPEIEEKGAPEQQASAEPPPAPKAAVKESQEDFAQVPLPKIKGGEKYRLDLKPEELEPEHVPVEYELPSEKISMEDVLGNDDEPFSIRETKVGAKAAPPLPIVDDDPPDEDIRIGEKTAAEPAPQASLPQAAMPSLSPAQLEKIIREQSAEVIESVVWKVVPDLAAQIIERELNKLLKERETQTF